MYQRTPKKAENRFGLAKRYTNNTVMNTSGCPACCWLLCLQYICVVLNHLASPTLQLSCPVQAFEGMTEFRLPLQLQSHLEMPGILVQLGHIQRTYKLAPQIDLKWSPTGRLRRYQAICPLLSRNRRYVCQISRAQRTHSRP